MKLIGSYDDDEKILGCRTMSLFPKDRLSNLYGKTLKSSSFEYKPYTYVTDKVDENGDPVYDGVEVSTNVCLFRCCLKHVYFRLSSQ